MAINYVLTENHLNGGPDTYVARVQPIGTAQMEDIIARIVQQGSTVVKADILCVLEDYFSAIESILLEGRNVNTPLANYRSSIRGIFHALTDGYDPSRHRVVVRAMPGKRLRKIFREQARVVKQERVKPKPNPLEYTDVNSGVRNSAATPGGMGRLVGHRLKFDPADPQQGIFFVAADGSATRAEIVGKNVPGELSFLVPALAPGDYALELRTAFNNGEGVRIGVLEEALTVG